MNIRTRPVTPRRLDRIMRWSGLWLMRLAAWIVQAAGVAAPLQRALDKALRPKLKYVARGITWLIVAKAMLRLKRPKHMHGGAPCVQTDQGARAIVGSRLRTLVRARDLRAIIAAALMLIRNADEEIARCARRLKNGLTRRCGGLALTCLEALCLACAWAFFNAAIADTS